MPHILIFHWKMSQSRLLSAAVSTLDTLSFQTSFAIKYALNPIYVKIFSLQEESDVLVHTVSALHTFCVLYLTTLKAPLSLSFTLVT
jgi:hypothetical protein